MFFFRGPPHPTSGAPGESVVNMLLRLNLSCSLVCVEEVIGLPELIEAPQTTSEVTTRDPHVPHVSQRFTFRRLHPMLLYRFCIFFR